MSLISWGVRQACWTILMHAGLARQLDAQAFMHTWSLQHHGSSFDDVRLENLAAALWLPDRILESQTLPHSGRTQLPRQQTLCCW